MEAAQHLLNVTLKFDKVSLIEYPSKELLISELEKVDKEAEDFNTSHKDSGLLLVAIISIGEGRTYETKEPNQGEEAADKSRFLRRFLYTGWDNDGEFTFVALTEHTIKLTACRPSVHCLQIDDWEYLDRDASDDSLRLKDRSCRSRHTLATCDVVALDEHLSRSVNQLGRTAFSFPYHAKESGAKILQHLGVEPDEVMLSVNDYL